MAISYDLLGRTVGETWDNNPDLTVTYTYDSCDNGVGKLCTVTDNTGSMSYVYNEDGQVIEKASTIDGVTLAKQYSYDEQDKLSTETLPSGKVISYNYDVDKLTSISLDGETLISDVAYNAANQLTGWAWSDGTVYSRTYDDVGRLKTFPLADTTRTLIYDELGNITGWNDSGKDEYKRFSYDELNRLTRFNENQPAVELDEEGNEVAITEAIQKQVFEYDANGNRLALTDGVADTQVKTIYDILEESNRLSSVDETTYQYDENGNIINDGEHDYHYDSRNRLTQVDNEHQYYYYNANNMRVKKTSNGNTTLYGWDNDRIYAEYDASGNAIQETIYFGSTPIALLKDNSVYRIFADQIDTPRVIADQDNEALWSWESKPFGETMPNEDVDNDGLSLSYNLRFPGQYYDKETEKHYNFNRDYNPVTGRYIQSDPVGIAADIATYSYSENSVVLKIDPTGLAGIYPKDQGAAQWIMPFIERLKRTTAGLQLFNRVYNVIPQKVYLYSTAYPADADAGPVAVNFTTEYRIYIPLSFKLSIYKDNSSSKGCAQMSVMRVLAHELGHVANWENSEEATVDTWEDPVMNEIEGFKRVTYSNAFLSANCT